MFAFSWGTFGTLAALFTTIGIVANLRRGEQRATGVRKETTLVLTLAAIGFLLPALIRLTVLGGARLTDDEPCYRFTAQLLASGRLTEPSHPLKLFFDNCFMINDGRFFSQYFIGWPALMVPGTWLHAPGYMNSFYSALTVFPLYYSLRTLAGRLGATVGVIMFLSSPMLMIGAATELGHTTCLMALAYAFWFLVVLRKEEAPVWASFGLASALSIAFFIRPLTAVGLGAPMLVAYVLQVRSRSHRTWAHVLGFLVPALVFAILFLAVNKIMNQGFFRTGYTHYGDYAKANGFRFSYWSYAPWAGHAVMPIPGLGEAITRAGVAILRLSSDLLGWPLSFFLLLPIAGFTKANRVMWASLASFLFFGCFMLDSGIDSYGPVHYTEIALPVLVLLALAVCRAEHWLATATVVPERWKSQSLPAAVILALVVTTGIGFWPVRIRNLGRIAASVNGPEKVLASAGIHQAVVFVPHPFLSRVSMAPTRNFVHWQPTNDPDLKNDILWVNHLTPDIDRTLMAYFPGRKGYMMGHNPSGVPLFIPLESVVQ